MADVVESAPAVDQTQLKKELLLLYILATTSILAYSPSNGGFGGPQDLLDEIAAEYNTAKPPAPGTPSWNWNESSKVDTGGGVNVAQKLATALFTQKTHAQTLANLAFQPSASNVAGWPGGPTHPPVSEAMQLLGM